MYKIMLGILNHSPGQEVCIVLDLIDGYGTRVDGYALPIIQNVYLPDQTTSTLYPAVMTKLTTGMYYHKFRLPISATAVGTYIVDILWSDPTNVVKNGAYQIVVSAPMGQYSVSSG
jgi:hypothetical protein